MGASSSTHHAQGGLSRRDLLKLGVAAAATPAVAGLVGTATATTAQAAPAAEIEEATIAELQAAMAAGRLTAVSLTQKYLARIQALDRNGPKLNSIIEVNPDAEAIARSLDRDRRAGRVRGPLHGIPILLKDNIDTADRMQTTAGSLALVGAPAPFDSTTAARLRAAGAVILGKTNLSEWANFRSFHSSSGWSGRGGQCLNPYVLDRNPCGSSSGSGAATAANLCAAAIGTETDGSIVCPATANGVVGIKPTLGLTSRAGVVPIAHSQDTVGPHGRTVADAAAVLGSLTGIDPRDPATAASAGHFHADYTQFLDAGALRGARIGVVRGGTTGYSEETDALFEEAIAALGHLGATVVDPAEIPTMGEISTFAAEIVVLVYEFKRDLNAYLATRPGVPIRTLADAIRFNEAHADQELKWFGQEWFHFAEADPFSDADYTAALARQRAIGGPLGIDAVMDLHDLDALVAPTGSPAWTSDLINGDHFLGASSSPAAIAGYPLVSVLMGMSFGLPVGLTFMGRAWSEPTLIGLAHAFEQGTKKRTPPTFLQALPLNETAPRGRGRARHPAQAARRPLIGQL